MGIPDLPSVAGEGRTCPPHVYQLANPTLHALVSGLELSFAVVPFDVQPYGVEHALYVKVHHLCKGLIRMRIELLAPGCARIRK